MWHRLEAVVTVVFNLHAKPEPEWLQSGAGRPLLGRPASPRPAGLGFWPSSHRLCVDVPDCLLELV